MKSFVHSSRWLYVILIPVLLSCSEEEEFMRNDAASIAIDKAEFSKVALPH